MYDDSKLTCYDGGIAYLYLYDNATASFLGGINAMDVYIDPANTGWVKLYAYDVIFGPSDPYNDPLGPGVIQGNWLSNDMPFSIDLAGQGAYSHVQIIPEPTSLLLLGLGGLAAFRHRKR